MKNIINALCLICLFSCKSEAPKKEVQITNSPVQTKEIKLQIPDFQLDTSASQISLDDPKSYFNAFKEADNYIVKAEDAKHPFPYIEFFNAGLTEKMTTYFHPGNPKHTVSEFVIEKEKGNNKSYELFMIAHFKTTNGIKLGSTSKDVKDKIGEPLSIEKEGNMEVWHYSIEGNYDYLKRYNRAKYFAQYTFEKNLVNKIRFGFEYE